MSSVRSCNVKSHENKVKALNEKVQTFAEGRSIIQVNDADGIFRFSATISDMTRFWPLCLELPKMLALCDRHLCISLLWYVHSCPRYSQNTHTLCGLLLVGTLCSPSVSVDHNLFSLSHLIPPFLFVWTGKKQGPPENRNKGNPSIQPFIYCCSLSLHLSCDSPAP